MKQESISALEEVIRRAYGNLTGLIVQKDGVRRYEGYFNGYGPRRPVHVFSVTKSIFSALIGIALEKCFLKSVDQRVLDFFPDYRVQPGERAIQEVTLRHLLTMTAPYKCKTEPYEAFFASGNWVDAALDLLGGEAPSGAFTYSPIAGTHILSGILARATGRPILDFATEHLFGPLGIRVPGSILLRDKEEHMAVMGGSRTQGWVADPQGLNTAGWGLFLTPADMVSLGQLYLDGGIRDGQRLLPDWWIAESTREQSRWDALPYGYLWWIIDGAERSYAAMGDGGNVIYVNEKRGLVVAVASLFAPDAKDRIELIRDCLEPMFDGP